MAKKKYDPLWEIVDEKITLQGVEPDIDGICPDCGVRVHIGASLRVGEQVECGLCGSLLRIARKEGEVELELVE